MLKHLRLSAFALVATALVARAAAEEQPQPLWQPGDWDYVRGANNATTHHLSLFLRREDARKYCSRTDRVVWLDRHTGFFYTVDQPEYAVLMPGYYVCERQARSVGAERAK